MAGAGVSPTWAGVNPTHAAVPPQGSPVRPGHSFLRDGASLGMFRELMVVIRIWGLLKPSCLPVYTATSDTQDSSPCFSGS